jgi:hypothetical protein
MVTLAALPSNECGEEVFRISVGVVMVDDNNPALVLWALVPPDVRQGGPPACGPWHHQPRTESVQKQGLQLTVRLLQPSHNKLR